MNKALEEKIIKKAATQVALAKLRHKLPDDPSVEKALIDVYTRGAQDALDILRTMENEKN